jgi:hypothetical protein
MRWERRAREALAHARSDELLRISIGERQSPHANGLTQIRCLIKGDTWECVVARRAIDGDPNGESRRPECCI